MLLRLPAGFRELPVPRPSQQLRLHEHHLAGLPQLHLQHCLQEQHLRLCHRQLPHLQPLRLLLNLHHWLRANQQGLRAHRPQLPTLQPRRPVKVHHLLTGIQTVGPAVLPRYSGMPAVLCRERLSELQPKLPAFGGQLLLQRSQLPLAGR